MFSDSDWQNFLKSSEEGKLLSDAQRNTAMAPEMAQCVNGFMKFQKK